jgi:hypothetical protein
MSNYPPGAANDPNAPYNQEDPPEVEVTVTETLVKEMCICSYGSHTGVDYEYDPDEGRAIAVPYVEHADLAEDYKNDHRTAGQCLNDSYRVIKALYDERKPNRFYEHVDLLRLLDDLEGWQTEEFNVNEECCA